MIDFTKPLRRKRDGVTVRLLHAPAVHIVDEAGPTAYSLEYFEHYFENVPEPRRPRDFVVPMEGDTMLTLPVRNYPGVVIPSDKPIHARGTLTRLVEWPLDAPLPEWPR